MQDPMSCMQNTHLSSLQWQRLGGACAHLPQGIGSHYSVRNVVIEPLLKNHLFSYIVFHFIIQVCDGQLKGTFATTDTISSQPESTIGMITSQLVDSKSPSDVIPSQSEQEGDINSQSQSTMSSSDVITLTTYSWKNSGTNQTSSENETSENSMFNDSLQLEVPFQGSSLAEVLHLEMTSHNELSTDTPTMVPVTSNLSTHSQLMNGTESTGKQLTKLIFAAGQYIPRSIFNLYNIQAVWYGNISHSFNQSSKCSYRHWICTSC